MRTREQHVRIFYVRLAAHVANRRKSLISPNSEMGSLRRGKAHGADN